MNPCPTFSRALRRTEGYVVARPQIRRRNERGDRGDGNPRTVLHPKVDVHSYVFGIRVCTRCRLTGAFRSSFLLLSRSGLSSSSAPSASAAASSPPPGLKRHTSSVEVASKLSDAEVERRLDELKPVFFQHNQGHVFRFAATLTAEQKRVLLADLLEFHPATINTIVQELKETEAAEAKDSQKDVAPFPRGVDLSQAPAADRQRWHALGLELIARGKVAVVLMAGGQGTRLGSKHPKGMYNVHLPSEKSLFQLQAERLLRLKQLAADYLNRKQAEQGKPSEQHTAITAADVHIPWYIMTSDATDIETEEFFQQNKFFGLPKEDVSFFEQGMLPAVTFDGKIIMESPFKVSMAPNGNGGVYEGMARAGVLRHMQDRGVSHVHMYGVDNILVKIAHPSLVGFAAERDVDVVNKVVLKTDPAERVGVMALRGGKASVVEYSEITTEDSTRRDAQGQLLFNAGNIANHLFTTRFLETCCKNLTKGALQWHVARKKISYVSEDGKSTITPEKENANKLEVFVFDVFSFAEPSKVRDSVPFFCVYVRYFFSVLVPELNVESVGTHFSFHSSPDPQVTTLAVDRAEEFSPIKNAPSASKIVADSPDSARLDLSAYHRRLIERAGGKFADGDDGSAEGKASTSSSSSSSSSAVAASAAASSTAAGGGSLAAKKLVEISPLVSYEGEGLETVVKGKTFTSYPVHLQ